MCDGVADDPPGVGVFAANPDHERPGVGKHAHACGLRGLDSLVGFDHRQVLYRVGFLPGGFIEDAVEDQVGRQGPDVEGRSFLLLIREEGQYHGEDDAHSWAR